jgi:hypothetical protein
MAIDEEQLTKKVTEHLQTSYLFIEQAQEELNRGDILQASEKAWGAAARIVKAASLQRGWGHASYTALRKSVKKIATEANDQELPRLFRTANGLHLNFYEGSQDEEDVRQSINDVKLLIGKVEIHIFEV